MENVFRKITDEQMGTINYANLFRDIHGRDWNILIRPDGSVSLYYTVPGGGFHGVLWDSLDLHSPEQAASILTALTEMREGINALLDKMKE